MPETITTTTLKITFDGQTRRLRLSSAQLCSFAQLNQLSAELFPALGFADAKYTYVDPDGDHITIADDRDVQEAISIALAASERKTKARLISSKLRHGRSSAPDKDVRSSITNIYI